MMYDRDARLIAQENKLTLSGTIGILLKAKERRLVPNVRPLLDSLRDNHRFWISNEMYTEALRLAVE